ncbi:MULTISPECIES: ATP-binding protein [Aliagarivorans]|uniref:ATP-binding protein n=1 Tax=Aliagarivorans TaxID=882379 RepID=UPI00040434A6|nr:MULTISPECIES: ATP-binding protein [Aliagarivorans]
MTLPENTVDAVYQDPGVERYRGNPFIEALPPIMQVEQVRDGLRGKVSYQPGDAFSDGRIRAHEIAGLLDDFFQPLANHLRLEEKISIMMRRGYVGRNLEDGSLKSHLQDGYERIKRGELSSFRFAKAPSTASSFALIGVSGCGKSTTLNRILANYPQVIYHEKYNFIQLVHLKIECPAKGTLKSLCVNFFRAIDQKLNTNYEQKYTQKRVGTDTLLALMGQIATQRAIGILVIDEIQRLSRQSSDDEKDMLEFFVELVNTIGVPVVLVGTPKARPILELELQSGRRVAGFGSLFWEPMKNEAPERHKGSDRIKHSEWSAFARKLWRYQWLQRKDDVLTDELRDGWYELTQGVHDIVVKLFVLTQLWAIANRSERISLKLMRKVFEDEFKPVHPMLAALRSGDPELVVKYSDLHVPQIDKQLLDLRQRIAEAGKQEPELGVFDGNPQAQRLYHLLVGMDCEASRVAPLVERAFKQSPDMKIRELMPIVLDWYEGDAEIEQEEARSGQVVKPANWGTLSANDLRYQFSSEEDLYDTLNEQGVIFPMESWLGGCKTCR